MVFRYILYNKDNQREKFNSFMTITGFSVVVTTEGLTDEEKEKVHQACEHWSNAFNSPKFEECIINHPRPFTYAGGRTYRQVYDIIMAGKETLGDGKEDRQAQVYLRIDRKFRRGIIGYTYPASKWQWIYAWAFKRFTVEQVAGNLAHEFCHKLGFGDSSYSKSQDAVTYVAGNFVSNFRG